MNIEKVYELYFKDVLVYLYGITKNKSVAEDITQDTFLKAIKNIDKFDGSKDIRAWLFTIAKNSYYTHYNRQKRFTSSELELNLHIDDSNSVIESVINKEENLIIHKCIHTIREPYKEVFMLRFFGDLSYEKIGVIFGKSDGWARITYYRAKKQILEQMEEINNE